MIILGLQIFAVLFGIFMLYITFLYRKRKEFTAKEGIFWLILWLGFIIISAMPTILDFLIKDILSMDRRLDFFFVVTLIFLLGIVFHIYAIVRSNQRRIEQVVRKVALQKKK